LNFDNGHRQRQGQHNNKRGRGRNNRRPGGGSGGGGQHNGGGNSINRVYESNGPDVKVRGTAQTVAEKYAQLGRDAHSAGDNVMAESYFQFSEHYFRVMAAAQPVGQPTQQLRRPEDDEFEEDGGEGNAEGEAEQAAPVGEAVAPPVEAAGEAPDQRNSRPREGRERFKPRWQNRRDQPEGDQPREAGSDEQVAREPAAEQDGEWEAPSFLKRPAPVAGGEETEAAPEKRARGTRRPQREEAETAESSDPVQD
jgi:Domain of unknown function (DUF4167)